MAVKNGKSCRHEKDGFEGDKDELLALYRQMQTPSHRDACRKLFEASEDELNAAYRPNDLAITPSHVRAGLKWFFGHFSLAVDMTDEEAVALLNSATDNLACLRNQLSGAEALELLPDLIVRLSLLLGIYGAIARIAPDGPSRFIYIAFREARHSFCDGHTLIEYLMLSESLDSWHTARSYLRSLEAGFSG